METAIRVAGWMSQYEKAFKNAQVLVVKNDDERFSKALAKLAAVSVQNSEQGNRAEVEEHVISTSSS